MSLWREFFAVNQTIILFIYGLVFFLLGSAILWQSRRHSRLDLAQSLGWLGVFGITHGLHEWGHIFIPIQAEYLEQTWVETLLLVQIFLLAFSFTCLFQFGVETVRPPDSRLIWIQAVPMGLLLVWATGLLWVSQVPRWESTQLIIYANIWARYLLGFPGAIMAAAGLWLQTQRQAPLQEFSHIAHKFRVASLALGVYAIFGGIIGPSASFFPANTINAEIVVDLLGMPPQVLRALAGIVLVVSIVRGLEIFELEVDCHLEEMEQSQILRAERERVSRELHDGAIQTVYTAGLMAESIRKKMDTDNPLTIRMDRVIMALQHAIRDLRQFIAELEPEQGERSLTEGLRKLVEDLHLQSLVEIEMTLDCGEEDCFSAARRTHVLAIVNESFSNIVRHAHARRAWLTAKRHDGQLEVIVADDGDGFPNNYVAGFGVRNMRDRARLLGGTLRFDSKPPHGTQVVLTAPWEDS